MRPAARSTTSTVHTIHIITEGSLGRTSLTNSPGMTKVSRGVSSEMTALGKTNAPVDISGTSGVAGEEGLEARMTLAK